MFRMFKQNTNFLLVLVILATAGRAESISSISAGPGTSLSAQGSFLYELMSSNANPELYGNDGIVNASVDFEQNVWDTSACQPIDPSLPARCDGEVLETVNFNGPNGGKGGLAMDLSVDFSEFPDVDDFDGYFIACNGVGTNGFSSSPSATCALPPGLYTLNLSLIVSLSPVTNAVVSPEIAGVSVGLSGPLQPVPEPNNYCLCGLGVMLMCLLGGQAHCPPIRILLGAKG